MVHISYMHDIQHRRGAKSAKGQAQQPVLVGEQHLRMRAWMLSYTSRMKRENASPVRSRTWAYAGNDFNNL
jgi:hypothetical protein